MEKFRPSATFTGLTLGSVVWGVVLGVWSCQVEAGPPFPWRPRGMGPAPYTQRQVIPQPPRSRPTPSTSDGILQEELKPSLVPSTEPTPLDDAAQDQSTSPPVRTRTYFTPNHAESLFPSGYGIHVGVSQKFLDELIRVDSQDAGPVRDCILGAQVVGSQRTETSLHIRLIPNAEKAELEFLLSGITRNSTENRTSQAVIQSEGTHRFEISKSVQFDGQQLLTRSPAAVMYPYQRNRAASTPASAIPILGPMVSQYALRVAEQQRPASERITAQRITEKVSPQFNDSVDQRLASLNTQLKDSLPKQLPLFGISTPTTRVRTTEKQMTVSFAWDTVLRCPEYVPAISVVDASELRVAVHAEAVNTWLASFPLGGLEIPVSDLDRWQEELERTLSHIERRSSSEGMSPGTEPPTQVTRVGRVRVRAVSKEVSDSEPHPEIPGFGAPTILGPILVAPTERSDKVPSLPEPEIEPTSVEPSSVEPSSVEPASGTRSELMGQSQMILAKENPLMVEFGSGEAVITLTAAFRMAPAPQTGYHRIRIPVTSQMQGEELIVTPGAVQVETMESAPGPLGELMRATIEKQVQQRLQPTRWPVERSLKSEAGNPLTLRLNELSSGSGWLSLVWGVKASKSEIE